MHNLKVICKVLGGSNLYGLQTPESDVDERGVFITTHPWEIIGMRQREFIERRNEKEDVLYNELRHAVKLLRNANTQIIELLFCQKWLIIEPEWSCLVSHRNKLIDSEKLYKCLCGYIRGELKLANGERTGKLGSKRKAALDLYGFSPKNFTQLLRLAWAGKYFFNHDIFPVNIGHYSSFTHELLYSIKTEPQRWAREQLNKMAQQAEEELTYAYNNRSVTYRFDEDFVYDFCAQVYLKNY